MLPVYFENAMGRILEHPNGYALLRYDPGRRSLVDVQNYLLHTGRLLHRQGWHKILSDQRLLTPFTQEEQALILDFWQARHFTLGPLPASPSIRSGSRRAARCATSCSKTKPKPPPG
jgi:hypothetical protein